MSSMFTHKQADLIRIFKHGQLKRINILEGSVRSGKTWISLVLWALWVSISPKDATYLMTAKTITSLKRNCLDLLQSILGPSKFSYSLAQKEGKLFGRQVYLEGANDERSESKIRGMTLQGAYCDELTMMPETFFSMLLSRLSMPNAKLFGTTNPDHPHHWLKLKYIDRQSELDVFVMTFLIMDNTFLDPVWLENIQKEYTGMLHDRFIKGLWVSAEGAIYRTFADDPERLILETVNPADYMGASIGLDFGGNKSGHAINATAIKRDLSEMVTVKDFYRNGIITPAQLFSDVIHFVKELQAEGWRIIDFRADSAEQVLIAGLQKALVQAGLGIGVSNAIKGPISDRIRFYSVMQARGSYKILRRCTHTIDAFKTAVYDSKAHEDKRLDNGTSNIDSLDAQEYSTEPWQMALLYK